MALHVRLRLAWSVVQSRLAIKLKSSGGRISKNDAIASVNGSYANRTEDIRSKYGDTSTSGALSRQFPKWNVLVVSDRQPHPCLEVA